MKHNYKKGIVELTFVNKKGIQKTVRFPMKKSYYEDICELKEEEQSKWLIENYKYYTADKYQEKKHNRHRDKFITSDFDYDGQGDDEDKEHEEIKSVSKKKIQSLAFDPKYVEKLILEEMVKTILSGLTPVEKMIVVECVMNSKSVLSVSKKVGLNESSVRRKKDKIIQKLKEKYKNFTF